MPRNRTVVAFAILFGLALTACGVGGGPAERKVAAPPPTASLRSGATPSASADSSGAPSSSPTVATTRPTGSAVASGRCATAQLTVDAGQVQAAASTRTLVLGLTNVSNTHCTISGFGGLALLGAGGSALPTRFERSPAQPQTVELAPQGVTTRTITWQVVPAQNTDPATNCVSGDALLVTPPDEQPANLVVHAPITACQGGTITGTPWGRDAG